MSCFPPEDSIACSCYHTAKTDATFDGVRSVGADEDRGRVQQEQLESALRERYRLNREAELQRREQQQQQQQSGGGL